MNVNVNPIPTIEKPISDWSLEGRSVWTSHHFAFSAFDFSSLNFPSFHLPQSTASRLCWWGFKYFTNSFSTFQAVKGSDLIQRNCRNGTSLLLTLFLSHSSSKPHTRNRMSWPTLVKFLTNNFLSIQSRLKNGFYFQKLAKKQFHWLKQLVFLSSLLLLCFDSVLKIFIHYQVSFPNQLPKTAFSFSAKLSEASAFILFFVEIFKRIFS